MKLMERMKQKRVGNKGFSLVELIIVIAIMAILIGIVGTQVVPYLRRAREEKDMQIIDAFSTAAVTFYSLNSDKFANQEQAGTTLTITWKLGEDTEITVGEGDAILKNDEWNDGMKELTGYGNTEDDLTNLQNAMTSAEGKTIISLIIEYNFGTSASTSSSNLKTPAGAVSVQGQNDGGAILEIATSYIGSQQ